MRPGGLTALAVFNFVFGGLAAISNLLGLAFVGMVIKAAEDAQRGQQGGMPIPSANTLYLLYAFGAIRAGLLIMSGVGYIGLRRKIGWLFGNVYALCALVGIALELTLIRAQFSIFSLIDFVYPLITLFLLNVIFRKDFVR